MSKKGVTEAERRLICALKDSVISKDDATVIALMAREYDIVKEVTAWIETHDKPTYADIAEYIYTELVEASVKII